MIIDKQNRILSIASIGGLAIFFYLFYLLNINPELIYFKQQPSFLVDSVFFSKLFHLPGGLIEYISRFILQFNYFPWFGALLITLIVVTISELTVKLLESLNFKGYTFLIRLLPTALLLYLHSQYRYKLSIDMILLVVLISVLLYRKIAEKKLIIKIFSILILSLLIFWTTGGIALMLFALLAIIVEIHISSTIKDKLISIIFLTVLAATIPYLGIKYYFIMTLKNAYFDQFYLLDYHNTYKIVYAQIALITIFPLFILYAHFTDKKSLKKVPLQTNNKQNNKQTKKDNKKQKKKEGSSFLALNLSLIGQISIGIIILIATSQISINKKERFGLKISYLADKAKWEEILNEVNENPSNDRYVNFNTNRALLHTGKLAENIFAYPQSWGVHSLFIGELINRDVLTESSDLFYDIGHICESQHWAFEAQTIFENSPRILKRLVLTHIINKKYRAAKKALNILSKNFIYNDWTKKYAEYIKDHKLADVDAEIIAKRKQTATTDFFSNRKEPYKDLDKLLIDKPNNKNAFEYIMANHMLTHELGKFVKNLQYLDNFNYTRIPKSYEEALLIYMGKSTKTPNLGKFKISKETIARFQKYTKIRGRYKGDKKAAQKELKSSFGDTYWFYLQFTSPITNKRKLIRRETYQQ